MNRGERHRKAMAALLLVGSRVQSRYRARWHGVVLRVDEQLDHCVIVRITHDRRGKPIRKPFSSRNVRRLDESWLKVEP